MLISDWGTLFTLHFFLKQSGAISISDFYYSDTGKEKLYCCIV